MFPMKILALLSSLLLTSISTSSFGNYMILVSGQCQSNQELSLLQMKSSLVFNSSFSLHLEQWNQSTDCCTWNGVDCDADGHVIGLDLRNESISGGIENATGLSGLQYLESLNLAFNQFEGVQIPTRLANLTNLTHLNLSTAGFAGQIPDLLSGMKRLVTLDLSSNYFAGPIPSFNMSRNLSYLDLSKNDLSGAIPSTGWEQLLNLVYVDLSYNSLNGSIPPFLFTLPSLQKLQLSSNQFEGQIPEISNASSSVLETLDLSGNNLKSPIPMSVFQLKNIQILELSSNKFNGTIELGTFQRLGSLTNLDLSYNDFTVKAGSDSTLPPQVSTLRLASCKLSMIPNLRNQSQLTELDLSDNQITGLIPNWIWEVGNGSLQRLNLSHNLLVGMDEPYSISHLSVLDLHSNQLKGSIPSPPSTAVYVDYSSNNFSSSTIPVDIGNSLSSTIFFSLSNNSLTGVIPDSFCNATKLQVLNLSNNKLSGSAPVCLTERSKTLGVLNLGGNNLSGTISDTFPENCGLQTLVLNGNQLEGIVPKSLANCTMLEVLDLGNNRIEDTFPCWLKNAPRLRVLVFRSNKFHGSIGCLENNVSWPLLQIVDLASNKFRGGIPKKFLTTWKSMMVDQTEAQSNLKQLRYEFRGFSQLYYQDAVTVVSKGQKMELVKILTVFTSIDVSCNNIEGPIPLEVGLFKALHIVNLSHNSLTGPIPSSVSELRQLESLDLSMNNMSGEIPSGLASLSFISFLNLSYNHFVGRIPLGTQLQSFSASSFEGNEGLCGLPLTKKCTSSSMILPATPTSNNEIEWEFVIMSFGFLIGFGAVVTPLTFSKKVNNWYDRLINKCKQRFSR